MRKTKENQPENRTAPRTARRAEAIACLLCVFLFCAAAAVCALRRPAGGEVLLNAAEPSVPVLVDLNLADAETLTVLPGIGETLSARLAEYREENGPFRSEEDVLAVYGIGPAVWEGIRPYVTFDTAASAADYR